MKTKKERPFDFHEILAELKRRGNPANVAGMARFGIQPAQPLGVPIPVLRGLAKRIGRDHALALRLWWSGIHEARILASMIDDPAAVTAGQMDAWARDFDSWDVCDQVCGNLFDKTGFAERKAVLWAGRKSEFVRRAGYAMIAALAWQDKQAPDGMFLRFLGVIERGADDDRNFVKKAVNWALRSIGKRNRALHKAALATARRVARQDSRSARWIAADAIRELTDPRTVARIKKRQVADLPLR